MLIYKHERNNMEELIEFLKEHKGNLGAYIVECLRSRLW